MLIKSTRFGELNIPDDEILSFPSGLPGFSHEKYFAFLPYESGSPFAFLQSTLDENLSFLVVEPFVFFKEYTFELDDQTIEFLGLAEGNPPRILNIVSVPENLEEMTANLLAPLVVNWEARKAMQLILEKTEFTTRHRIFPNGFTCHAQEGGE